MKPTSIEQKPAAVLIGSYNTMSTGVNIKRIHNIILATTTKSFIKLNQTVGRGMRLHEDKEKVCIYDITDDFSSMTKTGKRRNVNYALKHSEERINQYLDNGYPIAEKEIQL